MSGQDAAQGHHPARPRVDYPGMARHRAPDTDRAASKPDPGADFRLANLRPGRDRTLGAAQREWPEYNRTIIAISGFAGAAAIIASIIVNR